VNLILIRHSKSLINPNIPINTWGLSDEGISLAKGLNNLSQLKNLDVIYSSLQPKALETAIIATKDFGVPIKTDDRLTESTAFTNKFVSPEQLERNAAEYYSDKKLSINHGESFEETLERFNESVMEILKIEGGKENVGIVSHGNVLASFASQYSDKTPLEIEKIMEQPDVAVLDWENKHFLTFFGELI
jgi:broad specificity phosphatase PhoE